MILFGHASPLVSCLRFCAHNQDREATSLQLIFRSVRSWLGAKYGQHYSHSLQIENWWQTKVRIVPLPGWAYTSHHTGWLLLKAGTLEHSVQPGGSATGWTVSLKVVRFVWASPKQLGLSLFLWGCSDCPSLRLLQWSLLFSRSLS